MVVPVMQTTPTCPRSEHSKGGLLWKVQLLKCSSLPAHSKREAKMELAMVAVKNPDLTDTAPAKAKQQSINSETQI